MLFHCWYEDEWPTVLVEADNEADAIAAAAEYNEGDPPDVVTPLRRAGVGVVVNEIHFDDARPEDVPEGEDPKGFDIVSPELPEDLEEVLRGLEGAAFDAATATSSPAASGEVQAVCGDTIEEREGGPLLVCALAPDHDGDHQGRDERGEVAAWPQEG